MSSRQTLCILLPVSNYWLSNGIGAGMSKKGFLSIGEFSKLTGIPRSKLIYYDEIGLFPSAERGDNGYRYYTLNQIILANFISDTASFGVALKELLPLLHDRNPQVMIETLEQSIKKHKEKIAQLKESQSIMEVMVDLMEKGVRAGDTVIEIAEYEPHSLILGGENIHQDASTFYPAWLTFMNSAKKANINIKYPVGGYFEDMDRFVSNPNMPSRFYFVNPRGKQERGGGKWLAGYTRGFYGDIGGLPQRMLTFAEEKGLELTGAVYNTYLLDEVSTVDPNQYLLRASVKIVED